MPERITYTTDDGVKIVGDWTAAPTMIGAVVFLHMMPANRSSWAGCVRSLTKRGIGALAIDLRGHGESTVRDDGTKLDYRQFTDDEHQSSIWDVSGAVDWLKGRGIPLDRIVLMGASIGADLAIRELAEEPRMAGAVLLSPGIYRGMDASIDVKDLLPDHALTVVVSEDDNESYAISKKMYDGAPVIRKTLLPYQTAGHGTNILSADSGLVEKLAKWIESIIRE